MYKSKDLKGKPVELVTDEIKDELDMEFIGQYEEELHNILKSQEHYLTFAYNVKYDGTSGFKIYDNLLDAFTRDYDYY